MIHAIALLLAFQLAGEIFARLAGLPLPGPVIGMTGLLAAFALFPRLFAIVQPAAQGLLGHLSLLFVPAGVGIVGHLGRLGSDFGPILVAIVASTVMAMAVGAGVFIGIARLSGNSQ